MTTEQVNLINWDILSLSENRVKNSKLSDKYNSRVYCHEDYADELCEMMSKMDIFDKEVSAGAVMNVIDINEISNEELHVTLEGFIDAFIKLSAEKKFFSSLGLTQEEFLENLNNPSWKKSFLDENHKVRIEGVTPYLRASLYSGQAEKSKNEFFDQITSNNSDSAYKGKIIGKNHGGFIINVQGVEGFLPGSLAATNIVKDFDDMIGKEIPVMVEDYLRESSTFIFSYKKYISRILPKKIEELDKTVKYSGTVTGTTKYGIFLEFDDIYTGLIHTSKMTSELKENFTNGKIRPGKKLSFWIREITHDRKIILTDEDPSIRLKVIDDFRINNEGTIRKGEVISVQHFGTLVRLEKDIVGLISQKELKDNRKKYNIGDSVDVFITKVTSEKIYLSINIESPIMT